MIQDKMIQDESMKFATILEDSNDLPAHPV
jgi:hypothetical protein